MNYIIKNTIKSIIVFLITFIAIFGSLPQTVNAQAACSPGGGALTIPTWYQYLPGKVDATGKCQVDNEALKTSGGSAVVLIGMGIFSIMLFLAGFLAFAMVVWGGYKLVTSTGEPGKITAARTTIFNALIGLAVAVIASQFVGFIAGTLNK